MQIGVLKAIAGAIKDANSKQRGKPSETVREVNEIPTVEIFGELTEDSI